MKVIKFQRRDLFVVRRRWLMLMVTLNHVGVVSQSQPAATTQLLSNQPGEITILTRSVSFLVIFLYYLSYDSGCGGKPWNGNFDKFYHNIITIIIIRGLKSIHCALYFLFTFKKQKS